MLSVWSSCQDFTGDFTGDFTEFVLIKLYNMLTQSLTRVRFECEMLGMYREVFAVLLLRKRVWFLLGFFPFVWQPGNCLYLNIRVGYKSEKSYCYCHYRTIRNLHLHLYKLRRLKCQQTTTYLVAS